MNNNATEPASPIPITITASAAQHVTRMLNKTPGSVGLRIHVDKGGCNGFKFHFQPTAEFSDLDHHFEVWPNLSVFVNKKMYLFIEGSEIDFEPSPLSPEMGKLHLKNPQEKGSCGCGESFNV